MFHATIQLLLYALLAGLSPVALAATVTVMPAGRLKVLGFASAFVLAQLVTCVLFVVIGVAATTRNHRPVLHASLELALAAALVWLAFKVRRRPRAARERSNPRTQALLERFGRLRFATTLLAGLLLGIGGPKRLVLTALAATTITTSGIADSGEAALVVLYVVLATVLVWGPAVLFAFLGERSIALMKRAQNEVTRRQPKVTVYALLVLAAGLVADAIGNLLV
jgi:threonine/homoserine/homoserine lactone efflux protein